MSPESVRESVRERGTTPSETSLKQFPSLVDSFGSCRLELAGVAPKISFTPERSSVRIGQCPPSLSPTCAACVVRKWPDCPCSDFGHLRSVVLLRRSFIAGASGGTRAQACNRAAPFQPSRFYCRRHAAGGFQDSRRGLIPAFIPACFVTSGMLPRAGIRLRADFRAYKTRLW